MLLWSAVILLTIILVVVLLWSKIKIYLQLLVFTWLLKQIVQYMEAQDKLNKFGYFVQEVMESAQGGSDGSTH